MIYPGSKRRIAHHIIPLMLKHRAARAWVEPFVGGANSIQYVTGRRIGNDKNEYVIALLKAVRDGWRPPTYITEDEYKHYKQLSAKGLVPGNDMALAGFILTQCPFGGRWGGGFGRCGNGRIRAEEASRGLIAQAKHLQGITFHTGDYDTFPIPLNSLIYCDPPYIGRPVYRDKIDHVKFWDWCRYLVRKGHSVYVSEYVAPEDFISVWSGQLINQIDATRKNVRRETEQLFVHRSATALLNM